MSDADLAILRLLQEDSTLSLEAIGQRVNLSVASCHRRIKALEARGAIVARRAELDAKVLGFGVTGIFLVRLDRDDAHVDRRLLERLKTQPEVTSCHLVTGEYDFIMIAKFRTAEEYTDYIYDFLETYKDVSIQSYTSSLAIRALRENGPLPI